MAPHTASTYHDALVKKIVRVVDKRAFIRHDNILRLRPRMIHDDLVESGHQEVHVAILRDLDFVWEYHMVRRIAWLGRIGPAPKRDGDA